MLEKHGEITEETPPEGLQKTAEEKVNHTTKRASDAAFEEMRQKVKQSPAYNYGRGPTKQ